MCTSALRSARARGLEEAGGVHASLQRQVGDLHDEPEVAGRNGVDDDCNGTIDDGYASTPTSCGTGACGRTAQRQVQTEWNHPTRLPDVVLTQLDPVATSIDISGTAGMQAARGGWARTFHSPGRHTHYTTTAI